MNEALNEWLDKTEWVQKTAHPSELGMHRADVIKARYDALVGALTLVLSCARMAGPAGTTAYLISDARMEAALDALGKATGQPTLTKATGDAA